jgi:hypothetical protein
MIFSTSRGCGRPVAASGLFRDSPRDWPPVVRDGNYVSARWPGDVHTFARTFAEVLEGT